MALARKIELLSCSLTKKGNFVLTVRLAQKGMPITPVNLLLSRKAIQRLLVDAQNILGLDEEMMREVRAKSEMQFKSNF